MNLFVACGDMSMILPGSTYRFVLVRYDLYNLSGILEGSFQERRFVEARKLELENKAKETDTYVHVVKATYVIFVREESFGTDSRATAVASGTIH